MQFIRNNDREDGKPIIYNSAAESGLIKTNFDITKFVKKSTIAIGTWTSGSEGAFLQLSPDNKQLYHFSNLNGAFFNVNHFSMIPMRPDSLRFIAQAGGNMDGSFPSRAFYISPDGLNFYMIYHYPLEVRHYISSTPWEFPNTTTPAHTLDISYITASNMAYYGMWPSITFKPDGTQMYCNIPDDSWQYKVHQFELATAWNPATATTPATKILNLGDSDKNIAFSPDGTKMFWARGSGGTIYAEPLGTAWDISTPLYGEPSLNVLVSDMYMGPQPFAFAFNEAGNRLYVFNGTNLDEWHFVG